MLTDDDIRTLLARKSEGLNLDYKEGFAWMKTNRDKKYELVRDMLGMANTKDGGRIILGVRDADFEYVGVTDEIYDSMDPNGVVQMTHDNSAPKLNCEVIKRVIDGRKIIVLDVAEFGDTPIICTNTITSTEGRPRSLLREAAIYVRTSAATTEEVKSPDEMRSLLGRALTRKRDTLLQDIQALLTGKTIGVTPSARDRYDRELTGAHEFLESTLGSELERHGYWEVIAYPTEYGRRIGTIPEAQASVRSSEVRRRQRTKLATNERPRARSGDVNLTTLFSNAA